MSLAPRGVVAPAPVPAATASPAPRTKPDGFLTYMFGAQDRPPSIYGGPKMGGLGLGMAAASAAGPSMSRSPSATRAPPPPAVPQVTFGSNGELSVDSDGGGLAPAARSGAADSDEFTIALIRMLITSYFGVVRKTLADTVPKAVMHLLVNETKEALQNRLVQALYRDELVEGLLAEDPEVVAQREECRALLEVYQQALEVIAQAY
ncbi:hypothetical protein AMAG_06248 [Allomyces macrogynus ATCC 38327]|uniref:GED domain-containing protein n=1 Tax=Allomyces macrogynus (strain ATCC 38327) TaxID=578462 RepID=A0A0L0SG44_ALLM3|nr:hypothetical protein AMAG_06248 [Allomyces macrogynus ATCC 38327]|eukprot:KNE61419.1 hypothetical protein AMAG_06248 [Allomyces macrogynus ATCC 38327]